MNIYANGFVNRYKVTKTIGFGLIPVEGTGTMIRNNTILENDIGLADSFKKMKVTCDRYHKEFIQDVLKTAAAPAHYGEYCALINSNSEKGTSAYDKALKRVRETLKAEISALFTKAPVYNDLFKKEFITELLPEFVKDREEEMYYDDAFKITHSKTISSGIVNLVLGVYNKCDAVWAVNHETAGVLRAYGYRGNIDIAPNGTDVYDIDYDRAAETRNRLGIPEGRKILLFVGQIVLRHRQALRIISATISIERFRPQFFVHGMQIEPFAKVHINAFHKIGQLIRLLNNCIPKTGNRWIQVVQHDRVDLIIEKQLNS